MKHRVGYYTMLTFATVVATACSSSSSPTESLNGSPCQGDLSVSVTAGASPTIDWSPKCALNTLSVEVANPSAGGATTVWAISAGTLFTGPVSFGVLPPDATNLVPLVALTAGTTYRVRVGRTAGEALLASQGSTTFVR